MQMSKDTVVMTELRDDNDFQEVAACLFFSPTTVFFTTA